MLEKSVDIEGKIERVKRDFIFYALTIVLVMLLNFLDGGFESKNDAIRGFIRIVGITALAFTLFKRQKLIWWIATIISGLLGTLGVFACLFFLIGFAMDLSYFLELFPIFFGTIFLLDAFFILINKNVRSVFIH